MLPTNSASQFTTLLSVAFFCLLLTSSVGVAQPTQRPTAPSSAPDTSQCRFTGSVSVPDSLSLYTSSSPRMGLPDAPVRIVEFFDPNCPHCRSFHKRMLPRLKKEVPEDSVSIYMRAYPLSKQSYPQFFMLHYAAEKGRYATMLDAMFSLSPSGRFSRRTATYYSKAADLNPDSTFRAITSGRYANRVQRSIQLAESIGVDGTPTLVINGQKVARSSYTPSCLGTLIRREM